MIGKTKIEVRQAVDPSPDPGLRQSWTSCSPRCVFGSIVGNTRTRSAPESVPSHAVNNAFTSAQKDDDVEMKLAVRPKTHPGPTAPPAGNPERVLGSRHRTRSSGPELGIPVSHRALARRHPIPCMHCLGCEKFVLVALRMGAALGNEGLSRLSVLGTQGAQLSRKVSSSRRRIETWASVE
jgi:hypothetical protein